MHTMLYLYYVVSSMSELSMTFCYIIFYSPELVDIGHEVSWEEEINKTQETYKCDMDYTCRIA